MNTDISSTEKREVEKYSGLSLAISFGIFGILMITNIFSFNSFVSKLVGTIFLFVSFIGLTVEINKLFGNENRKKFFGIGDILGGILLMVLSSLILLYVKFIIISILFSIVFLFSLNLLITGIIKIFRSFNKSSLRNNPLKSIFLFISQVSALVLTLMQLYDMIIKI